MKDLDLLHKLLHRVEKVGARIPASLKLLALKVNHETEKKKKTKKKHGSHSKVGGLPAVKYGSCTSQACQNRPWSYLANGGLLWETLPVFSEPTQ
jgi:hypothetical protein